MELSVKQGQSPTNWDSGHPAEECPIFLLLMPTKGDQVKSRDSMTPSLKQWLLNFSLPQNPLEGSGKWLAGSTLEFLTQ